MSRSDCLKTVARLAKTKRIPKSYICSAVHCLNKGWDPAHVTQMIWNTALSN